jgi:hypothetical protein
MINSVDSLSHASKFKNYEDKIGFQYKIKEIDSEWSKTLVGDLKDGKVMVPTNYFFEDDTCLLELIANYIEQ